MRKFTVACIGFAVMAFAGTAAAGEDGSGPELGLRLGYGIPMGDAAKDAPLSDGVKSMIPIWIDAGYRIDPSLFAGIYFQYGLLQLADDACPSGADCSGSDMRFGVQGQYHFSPGGGIDPWAGLGIGYEIASSKVSAGGAEATASNKGMEFLNLQVGGDFELSPGMAVGPFLSFSLGQYSSAKVETPAGTLEGDITDKAMHQWLVIGVRGAFTL